MLCVVLCAVCCCVWFRRSFFGVCHVLCNVVRSWCLLVDVCWVLFVGCSLLLAVSYVLLVVVCCVLLVVWSLLFAVRVVCCVAVCCCLLFAGCRLVLCSFSCDVCCLVLFVV